MRNTRGVTFIMAHGYGRADDTRRRGTIDGESHPLDRAGHSHGRSVHPLDGAPVAVVIPGSTESRMAARPYAHRGRITRNPRSVRGSQRAEQINDDGYDRNVDRDDGGNGRRLAFGSGVSGSRDCGVHQVSALLSDRHSLANTMEETVGCQGLTNPPLMRCPPP